jgi:hypothetical protein
MTRARDIADQQDNLGGAVAPFVAGKNAVINGGFDIWQRGTSFPTAGGAPYNADRWFLYRDSVGVTVSRQLTNDTTNLANIQYCNRVQRDSGNTSTSSIYLAQSFESANSRPFTGKIVTLSFYARAGANYSSSSSILIAGIDSGTGTDQNNILSYTGYSNTSASLTLTSSWQRFTFTATILTSTTEMGVRFYYTPTGTAGANDYFEITGVQLELGAQATPFARAGGSIGGELALCQRYYFRTILGNTIAFGTGVMNGSAQARTYTQFPVAMRTNPPALDYANVVVFDGTASFTPSGAGLVQTTQTGAFLFWTVSGSSGGRGAVIQDPGTSNAYIALSAEL